MFIGNWILRKLAENSILIPRLGNSRIMGLDLGGGDGDSDEAEGIIVFWFGFGSEFGFGFGCEFGLEFGFGFEYSSQVEEAVEESDGQIYLPLPTPRLLGISSISNGTSLSTSL